MNNILMFPMICFIVMLSSCLTSLHPLVTADKVMPDNRVLGSWVSDDDTIYISKFNESEPYKGLMQLQPSSNANPRQLKEDSIMYANGYGIAFRKDGVSYFMFGALTRIDNTLYFDLIPVIADDPQNKESTGYEYSNDYLPTFTMAKLEMTGNNAMTLRFLNGDFIKELLKNGQARIKHEKDPLFETFLVTASTEELRQFIGKYSHDDRLFSKENSITLTRKG